MEDVGVDGKTVLLVSHNMASILSLSTRCVLLSEGRLIEQGSPQKVVSIYQNQSYEKSFGQTDLSNVERYGNGQARFFSIFMRAFDQYGKTLPFPVTGCDVEFEIIINAYEEISSATVALIVYDELGNRLIDINTLIKGDSLSLDENETAVVRFHLKDVRLKPDVYTVGLWLGILNVCDIDGIRYAISFRMEARREDILYTTPFPGVYTCEFDHEILSA